MFLSTYKYCTEYSWHAYILNKYNIISPFNHPEQSHREFSLLFNMNLCSNVLYDVVPWYVHRSDQVVRVV